VTQFHNEGADEELFKLNCETQPLVNGEFRFFIFL